MTRFYMMIEGWGHIEISGYVFRGLDRKWRIANCYAAL